MAYEIFTRNRRGDWEINLLPELKSAQNKVFISHRQADASHAMDISDAIENAGVAVCYLAVSDPLVLRDGAHLEKHLRLKIRSCEATLAVITDNTIGSWWVPFELGVAIDHDKHVATYEPKPVANPPSYLWLRPRWSHKRYVVNWVRETPDKDRFLRRFVTKSHSERGVVNSATDLLWLQ